MGVSWRVRQCGCNDPSVPTKFDLRALPVSVFLPTSLMAISQGATAPVIALVAIELGASVAVVGLFGLGHSQEVLRRSARHESGGS